MIMAFKIYLTNVKWDNSQKENIRFNSRTEQREYFNIPNIFTTSLPNVNFKINDGISAQAYYYSENTLANTLNYNYAIILDEQETNDSLKYKFYFVNRITHDSSRKCYNLELFLDIIQTYYIDLAFDNCLINRAHLDRFDANNWLDYSKNSKLYKKEDFNFSHNIFSRYYDCKPEQSSNSQVNAWLHKNVKCWCYYFLTPKRIENIKILANDNTTVTVNFDEDSQIFNYYDTNEYESTTILSRSEMQWGFNQKFLVLVAPIYTNDKAVISVSNDYPNVGGILSCSNVSKFITDNGLTDNIVSVKFSRLSPFSSCFNFRNYDLTISNTPFLSYLMIKGHYSSSYTYIDENCIFLKNNDLFFSVSSYHLKALPLQYYDDPNIRNHFWTNSYNEVFGSVASSIENIKLWNGEAKDDIFVKKLNINDGFNSYECNVGEIYSAFGQRVYIKYIEVLSIDISRYFVYLSKTLSSDDIISNISNNSPYYGKDNLYIGLTGSIDLSMPFSVKQLDTFLANNKNFYMQSHMKIFSNMLGKGITNAISQNYLKTGSSIIEGGLNIIDKELYIDNLANAPDNVENINGNPLFNVYYNGLNIRIEYKETFETDKKTFGWYLKRYGYKYNELDNVKTVDHIRHYFNYIQCDIDNVNTSYGLSIRLKDEIRKIFNNGICLWRYIQGQTGNLFDYSLINYEEKFN